MAIAVRERKPNATATTAPTPAAPVRPAPVHAAPIPTTPSRASAPERPSARAATSTEPRPATEARPRDPYDEPVNPWLLALYLVAIFLVLDVGMVWAGARLVAGTGG